MAKRQRIIFTVTNELHFDQRMIRICHSLQRDGYQVTLVGFKFRGSAPLNQDCSFARKRLFLPLRKGKLMYFIYWFRLFFYLLWQRADAICAIDLDTILPVYFAAKLKGCHQVYDAHELFTELKEVVTRPKVKHLWDSIEAFAVPRFPKGYTIGEAYAKEFNRKYGVHYQVVRNATVLKPLPPKPPSGRRYILYQGWVNEGRCFEQLIPAMQWVDTPLVICGEGNFFDATKALCRQYGVEDKVEFMGYVAPERLVDYTREAYIGVTLFQGLSKSNVLSMANRFFDYMHQGLPQICMAFPEYKKVNDRFEIARLIEDPPEPKAIAEALNELLQDEALYQRLSTNCLKARELYCWQNEEKTLLRFYQELFAGQS